HGNGTDSGGPNMGIEQQARWMWVLGVAVTFLVVWEGLRIFQPAPEPTVQREVCFVCRESGVAFGKLQITGDRSTFVLRDRDGQTCFILESNLEPGGLLGIRTKEGQWHWFPGPPLDPK